MNTMEVGDFLIPDETAHHNPIWEGNRFHEGMSLLHVIAAITTVSSFRLVGGGVEEEPPKACECFLVTVKLVEHCTLWNNRVR